MHLYPDGDVYYLKQALAKKLAIKPEQLLFGNGSNELVELMGHVFLGAGTNIVMADCAFVVYRLIAALFQAKVADVPMKDFTHDLDAMLKAITPDTRIVFVSNPNNPTSTMVDSTAIDRFMEKAPDSAIVCFDEAYIELLPTEKQPDVLKFVRQGRKAMVLRTFSKTYGLAGLRLGYIVASEECIGLMNRVRQPFNVNAMAQAAALAALDDDAYVEKTRKMVARGIRYLQREFRKMGLSYVPATVNFILVEVGKGREVFEALQKEGVIVRPMDGYRLPSYIRITVGKPAENRKCIEALKHVLGKG
jgi:histidinol-phosphate aminotransferase